MTLARGTCSHPCLGSGYGRIGLNGRFGRKAEGPKLAGSGMTAFERERRKAAVRDSLELYSPAVDASGDRMAVVCGRPKHARDFDRDHAIVVGYAWIQTSDIRVGPNPGAGVIQHFVPLSFKQQHL